MVDSYEPWLTVRVHNAVSLGIVSKTKYAYLNRLDEYFLDAKCQHLD